ncbi:hypothetical protein K502DRAFT_367300 [Neoconidiobolus thromboides FSU 785]|nr:hypothetical protein K502DRAFT_367300 [Neoconidiobolus thromboides FSU 785]
MGNCCPKLSNDKELDKEFKYINQGEIDQAKLLLATENRLKKLAKNNKIGINRRISYKNVKSIKDEYKHVQAVDGMKWQGN